MAYNVESARKAGLSDAEINNYLANKYKYNLAGAREAGLADNDILTHLLAKDKPVAKAVTPTTVAPILSPEEQAGVGVAPEVTAPTVAAQPKPPSELAMGSEFGKGIKAGVIGLKSIGTGVNLLKDANFVGSAIQNLDVYKQIDEGKITSLADVEGSGLSKDQVRMYLAAKNPEARGQMKQNQQEIIDKRQGFIREGLSLFQQYQADAKKVKGVTPDATDIETGKDFGNWLAFNVGSGAVQLAPVILAAIVTGGAGAVALGTAMGVGETVSNRLEFIQNKVKDLSPEQQANEIEKYIRDTTNTTMAIGLASGALDLFGPVGSILRARAGKEGIKYLTKKEGLKAGIKEAPRDIAKEGLTGGAQEAIQISGKRVLGEQTGDVFSEENIKAVFNAGAAEAAGGLGGTPIAITQKVLQGQAAQSQEAAAKAAEEQIKILTKLNQPGVIDRLGEEFNTQVKKLRASVNPNTQKLYTEQEAYEVAGDAILSGGLLDESKSTIGGTDQSSLSVPSESSGTNTGAIDATPGDMAATGTTIDDVGSGKGTELNTLDPELQQRSLLKLMSLQDDLGTPPNPKEVNTLASELGIKVKKGAKVLDTLQQIRNILAPSETISSTATDTTATDTTATDTTATDTTATDTTATDPTATDTTATDTTATDPTATDTTATDPTATDTTATDPTATDTTATDTTATDTTATDTTATDTTATDTTGSGQAQVPQNLIDLHKQMVAADELASRSKYGPHKRNATMASRRYLTAMEKATGTKETTSPEWQTLNEAVIQQSEAAPIAASTTPPVTIGKPRGRPKTEKTPEQIATADATKKQQQATGRDAINAIDKAEKTLAKTIDEAAILERSTNEKEAQDILYSLRQERIDALSVAYGLSVDPNQKKKTAGTRAAAALAKADPQERELGKLRYEAKQRIGAPSRSEINESTNGQDNIAFEKFSFVKGAINYIANTGTPFERILAKRIAPFLNDVKFVIVDNVADMPTSFLQRKMEGAAGLYVPNRKTVYVMREGGINNTVVLHEALHAATVARIDTVIQLRDKGRPVPKELEEAVLSLIAIMDKAKENFDLLFQAALDSGDLGQLTPKMLEIPNDAFDDVKEFVAYGLSLPAMQDFLLISPGKLPGEAPGFINKLFNRFVQSIRQLFSMDESHKSALQDLIIVTDSLLKSSLPKTTIEPSAPLQAKAKKTKQLKIVENALRKASLSKTSTTLNASIGELISQTRNSNDAVRLMKATFKALTVGKLKLALKVFDTNDITRMAGDKISNIKVINTAVQDMASMRTRMIRELAEKKTMWVTFNAKHKKGSEILDDVINFSSILEVDPTKYPDVATALLNDSRLQQLEKDILNPPIDPKTNKPKDIKNLKKQKTNRAGAIKLIYEGGTYDNPITNEKYTMGGWNQLGKIGKGEGHAIYKMARESYKKTFAAHESILKEKIVNSNLPGDANDASTPKGKLMAAITKTFQDANLLEVYFPLMRYGNFFYSVGTGANSEFYLFESAVARNNALAARVEALNKAGDSRTVNKLIEDGDIDFGDDLRKLREKHIESSTMLKQIFEMLDQNNMTDIEAVKDNIYQMYLMTLPDKDIRRRFVHRQGKTGFSTDTLRNFITNQHTAANQLARLRYADKIRNGIASAYAEISQNPDKLKLATFIREISGRALAEVTPATPVEGINYDQVATAGNKFVFYWLLTSPKSALVQMTQLATVGLPTLGAEYGIAKTLVTAARYSLLWNKLGTSKRDTNGDIITEWGQPSINDSNYVNKHPNLAYRAKLKAAWNFANDRDIFMATYASDMTAMSGVPSGTYQGVISKTTRGVFTMMGGAFHHAERISKEIMFMSTFELAYADNKAKKMNDADAFDAATKKALQLTDDALFNYTQYNKPPIMKTPGGKIAFQFLTYPMQMTSYLIRNFYGMLPLLNKAGKKEAAIKFFGSLGMTGIFSGVTGLVLYSVVMGITDGMRELLRNEDDEDYDEDDEGNPLGRRSTDLWFRNWFIPTYFGPGSSLANFLELNEEQAKTLSRAVEVGPISAYTDLNVAPSVSLDGMWFANEAPSATSRQAFENFVLGLGGPLASLGGNFMASLDDFENGQLIRGFEKLSPAWLRGSLTATRLGLEGATTSKGDELMDPEFYTTGKLFAQTLGFASTEVAQVQKNNFMAKQVYVQIDRERTKLLNLLDVAHRSENDEKIEKIFEKIEKFNIKNSMFAISDENINESLQKRQESRDKSYQGLTIPDKAKPFIEPLVEGTRSSAYGR